MTGVLEADSLLHKSERAPDLLVSSSLEGAVTHSWKMPGAGGGGYLACVVEDAEKFTQENPEAIRLTIRRSGM